MKLEVKTTIVQDREVFQLFKKGEDTPIFETKLEELMNEVVETIEETGDLTIPTYYGIYDPYTEEFDEYFFDTDKERLIQDYARAARDRDKDFLLKELEREYRSNPDLDGSVDSVLLDLTPDEEIIDILQEEVRKIEI